MKKGLLGFGGVFTLLTALAVGCTDQRTPTETELAPQRPLAAHGEPTDPPPPTYAEVMQREKAIEEIKVSEKIGRDGGTIKIKEAGLKVDFPEGAVQLQDGQRYIEITVTALAGKDVAYRFEPHGIEFDVPVEIKQDLKETTAYKQIKEDESFLEKLEGAYFIGEIEDGKAQALEFFPAEVEASNSQMKYTIHHFSGYLMAQGRHQAAF